VKLITRSASGFQPLTRRKVGHVPPDKGHSGGPNGQSADELNAIEERRTQVAELVASHHTYREIAKLVGCSSSTVGGDVKAVGDQWRQRASADYAGFLAEEMAKLDLLQREVLPKALSGGPKAGVNLRAVDRVLAIRDRRARMLGLDAPSKVEATLKVEIIVRALEDTLVELGIDDRQVRPVLGRRLRELDAVP
jgi:hypothetical protein